MAHSGDACLFPLVKRTSGHLNSKGFLRVFLMTRATKKEQATTTPRVWKQIQWTKIMLNINKASRTICNESCQKSQQLQFAEIRKMVSVDPAWNILTCASQTSYYGWRNVKVACCENHSNVYTANEDAVCWVWNRKSIFVVSLDNNSTLYFILDNSVLKIGNCCWLVLLSVFLRLFIKKKFSGQEVVKLRCR